MRRAADATDCTMKYFMIDSLCNTSLLIIKSKMAQNDIVLTSREIQVINHELDSRQQITDKSMNDVPILPRVAMLRMPC